MDNAQLESCRSCTRKHDWSYQDRIPCLEAHKLAAKGLPGIVSVAASKLPGPCVFACTWQELLCFVQRTGQMRNYAASPLAESALNALRNNLNTWQTTQRLLEQDPDDHLYVSDGTKRVCTFGEGYIMIRAIPGEAKWKSFEQDYLGNVCQDIEHLGGEIKFGWAIADSIQYAPGECVAMLKEMTKWQNLVTVAATFGAFALAAACPATAPFAWCAGVMMDAAPIAEAGKMLWDFCITVRDAKTSQEIDAAAHQFATFLAYVLAAAAPAIAGHVAGTAYRNRAQGRVPRPEPASNADVVENLTDWFLRQTKEKWDQAAREDSHYHILERAQGNLSDWRTYIPHGMTEADFRLYARRAGMEFIHLADWCRLSRQRQWLVVMRETNESALDLHATGRRGQGEMVRGKPVFAKVNTNPRTGMIHRTSNPDEDISAMREVAATELRTRLNREPTPCDVQQYLRENRMRWLWNEEAQAEVLYLNGQLLVPDYDLMGIYVSQGGRWAPEPRWAVHNDNPALQAEINSEVRGIIMCCHGCQDFSGYHDGAPGRPCRQPRPDEMFLVILDGVPIFNNVSQLARFYSDHVTTGWPYSVR